MGDRRAGALFDLCAWLVPAAIAGAAVLMVLNGVRERSESVQTWRAATVAYGAAAVVCGVVATAAVARLTLTTLLAAAGPAPLSLARRVARVPRRARRWVGIAGRADVGRWIVAAGIAWWLWHLWPAAERALTTSADVAVGGGVLLFNFPGPKVQVLPLADGYYPAPRFALGSLLMVWLLTARAARTRGVAEVLRLAARWGAVVLLGLAMGWRLSDRQFNQYGIRRYQVAVLVALVETPLTLLVYLRLAALAWQHGERKVGGGLAAAALGTAALIAAPPAGLYMLRGLPRRSFDTDLAQLLVGVYVAVALAVGLLAASGLARLLVVLVAEPKKNLADG
jgi:hypothetical protein